MTTAAVVAAVLVAVVDAFQLALALGAPWGKASWGGRHAGVLPTRLRIASGVAAIVVYPVIALLILSSAGLVDISALHAGAVTMWILAGFFALGAAANLASRSKIERAWGPVALIVAICCVILALST